MKPPHWLHLPATPRARRITAAAVVGVLLLGLAAKLAADERSVQRDRAFVRGELGRVRDVVARTGETVASTTREIADLRTSFEDFHGRIRNATAEIEARQGELVALIRAQERMATHLDTVRRQLTADLAGAEQRLATAAERIEASKIRGKHRTNLEDELLALGKDVTTRQGAAARIETSATQNAGLLADAQAAMVAFTDELRTAEAAAARAQELEARSQSRLSRAQELTRRIEDAQREIEALTTEGPAQP